MRFTSKKSSASRFGRSRLAFPALVTVAALALAGCSSDDKADSDKSDGSGSPSGLSLVKDGQLTVCSDMPYKPFEFEENGKTTGFDYEVVSAMAKSMDLSGGAQFDTTPFDGIIPALVAKNCDMIASAMTITEERAKKVNFTDAYFDADQSLLVLKENADKYATLASMTGQVIGVQSGTTGETYAEEHTPEGATIKKFQTGDEMFPALISGDIAGALQDLPVNGYRATTAPDQFAVTETFKTGEQYGFAVRLEDTALRDALNEALSTIKDNGTYDEIYTSWFGEKK